MRISRLLFLSLLVLSATVLWLPDGRGLATVDIADHTLQGMPGPQAGAFFGDRLATGDVNGDGLDDVIAGAPGADVSGQADAGLAFVFLSGTPLDGSPDFTLSDPTPEAGANFGNAVTAGDVNGDGRDDVIVGARYADVGGNPNAGRAYVFLGGTTFDATPDAVLEEPTPEGFATFGWISAVGDVNGDGYGDVIVGAPEATSSGLSDAGEAFVFLGGASFNSTADYTLLDPMPQTEGNFGYSLATGDANNDSYDEVVVGAYLADVSGKVDAGRAYAFFGGDPFNTTVDGTLVEPTPEDGANFAVWMAGGDINGDSYGDLVVGAQLADVGATAEAGEAFVFLGAALPDTTADFTLNDPAPEAGARFGFPVEVADVDGDGYEDVAVGAYLSDAGGNANAGQAFIFRGGSPFNNVSDFSLQPTTQAGAFFGVAIAAGDLNGDTKADLVIGANGTGAGSAFLYLGADPFNTSVDLRYQDASGPAPEAFAGFGHAVATGDINGDLIQDTIVGTPSSDAGAQGAGRVFVFLGGGPFDTVPDFVLSDPSPAFGAAFGASIATGDVNGDGYDDVIVGAWRSSVAGISQAGEAFVFLGGSPFDPVADFTLQDPSPEENAFFGFSVAAGDVNGDSRDDVVVGAPLAVASGPTVDGGQAFVFLGGALFDATADFTLEDPSPELGSEFGMAVAVGDIDGTGAMEDVVVGAPGAGSPGEAHIFLGGSPFDATADATLQEPSTVAGTGFGSALAVGDVDGIGGRADVIVGAPSATAASLVAAGKAYVFLGDSPVDTTVDATLEDPSPEAAARFGIAIAVGDVDEASGRADVIVGASLAGVDAAANAGEAFVFLGAAPFNSAVDYTLRDPAPEASAEFASSLAVGDVNGDGLGDVLVGAPGSDIPPSDGAGQAFVFLGSVVLGDSDRDGCTDKKELQTAAGSQFSGGLRSPTNPYDYYDLNHDGSIAIGADILVVAAAFGPSTGPLYELRKDRGPTTGPYPWNSTAPDGAIAIGADILTVAGEFGHACPHSHNTGQWTGANEPWYGPHP